MSILCHFLLVSYSMLSTLKELKVILKMTSFGLSFQKHGMLKLFRVRSGPTIHVCYSYYSTHAIQDMSEEAAPYKGSQHLSSALVSCFCTPHKGSQHQHSTLATCFCLQTSYLRMFSSRHPNTSRGCPLLPSAGAI